MELIEAGKGIIESEWSLITSLESENGFENNFFGCSLEEYSNTILPHLQNDSLGIGLPEGYVPQTTYFLWYKNIVVGIFKVRHYVNDVTRVNGAGHIGYAIKKEYRGKGFASEGLTLAILKLIEFKDYDPKDDIIMGSHKDNPASLKVQINNGGKIVNETDIDYITVISYRDFVANHKDLIKKG